MISAALPITDNRIQLVSTLMSVMANEDFRFESDQENVEKVIDFDGGQIVVVAGLTIEHDEECVSGTVIANLIEVSAHVDVTDLEGNEIELTKTEQYILNEQAKSLISI